MILPHTNSEKGRLKATLWGYLSLGVIIMIIAVRNIIVIGPVLLEHFIYTAHIAAQLIPGISIDPLIDISLLLGGGFKTGVFLYAAVKATAEVFGIDEYKPLVWAFALFVIVASYWIVPDAVELKRWNGSLAIILLTIPFQVILPLAIFITSAVKRENKQKG
jgi:spore germination protein KB